MLMPGNTTTNSIRFWLHVKQKNRKNTMKAQWLVSHVNKLQKLTWKLYKNANCLDGRQTGKLNDMSWTQNLHSHIIRKKPWLRQSKICERIPATVELTTPNGSKIISGNAGQSKVTTLRALTTGNFPYVAGHKELWISS